MITGVVLFPLREGQDLTDPQTPASLIMRTQLADGIRKHGVRYFYYGQLLREDPPCGVMLVGWDTTDAYVQYHSSEYHAPHLEQFMKVASGMGVTVMHAGLEPPSAFDAAVGRNSATTITSMTFCCFPELRSDVGLDKDAAAKSAFESVAAGWSKYPVKFRTDQGQQPTFVYTILAGWVGDASANLVPQANEAFGKVLYAEGYTSSEVLSARFFEAFNVRGASEDLERKTDGLAL